MQASKSRDIGSLICAVSLVALSLLFYYDTTTMVDSDSYVFPRAVIFMLLIISAIRIVREVIEPLDVVRSKLGQNYVRSALLIGVMAICVSLIPYLGFYFSICIAYLSIMYLSMYEKWTNKRRWVYPVIATLVVSSLYLLFVHGFSVQFPEGELFG